MMFINRVQVCTRLSMHNLTNKLSASASNCVRSIMYKVFRKICVFSRILEKKTIFNGHPVLLVFSVNEHYLPTLLQHLKRLRAFVVSKHV